ncbi:MULTISPECIES: hypothetical protein [Sphingobium]|jgi:hypothetical protein|uniref:Uncharacterized protein n=1 Tax=Sphingobium fuliginis (strain ATCC 27551) TaxID=336203 RepID=A0A7M2GGP2_SPHSA|nr:MULTISPECIES: hypothetical protein [Sphingobium]QOT71743.1 hypothetical protein H5V43_00750 [Sphingobium fuliginis]
MKYDIRLLTKAADDLLRKVTNPRHRKILINYRRHAILEVCGRYEEILAEDLTVENPDYLMYVGGAPVPYKGRDRVEALYGSMVKTNICVMMFENELLRVDDTGFSTRVTFHIFMPAAIAIHFGAPIEAHQLDEMVIQTTDRIMVWDYNEDCKLTGENIWVGGASYRICPPDEVITIEECNRILMPLIDKVPEPG